MLSIRDIFRRLTAPPAEDQVADVVKYDVLSPELRVQICRIWDRALGTPQVPHPTLEGAGIRPASVDVRRWRVLQGLIEEELGIRELPGADTTDGRANIEEFFMEHATDEQALLVVLIVFQAINKHPNQHVARAAVDELNTRLEQHRIGYRFEDGRLLRHDADYLHVEVTREALRLLASSHYRGPHEEFLQAHNHYLHGRHRDAIHAACCAFESTMKAILVERKTKYDPRATASGLIDTCETSGLFVDCVGDRLNAVKQALLAAAVVRNKFAGHGQGPQPLVVPQHISAFALHLAGANMVMLVRAQQAHGSGKP